MVPTCVVHPGARHPCGSSPTGTARGSPPPGARACTAPDEEAARRAPGAFRQSDPGPRVPPDGGGRGRGPGRGTPPSWPSPRPCAGSPLHHQRDRVAELPAAQGHQEPRPLPLRRGGGPNCCGRRVCNIEDRRAAERAKDEEHARPLAQGQRVDSSRDRSPPTGAHRPRARPARRRLPRPNQPPSLTEPAYTETLTGSRGDLAGPGPGGPGPAPRQKSAGAHRRRRGHQADRGVPRPPQGVLLGGLQAPRLSRRRSTRRSPPRRGRPRTTPTATPARGRTWPRSLACRA